MQKIISNINNYCKKVEHVFIGVSGGPDSIFLLYMLNEARKGSNFKLFALHINYHLRSDDSNKDEDLVRETCKKWGIDILVKDAKRPSKGNLEKWARDIRYAFFKEILEEYNEENIFIAHTLDDLIETFFMKIISGRSINTIFGMTEKTKNNGMNIIRPLLSVEKKEIIEFLEKKKIKYRIDRSNSDIRYTRNFLRRDILNPLSERFHNWKEHFIDFYNDERELLDYANDEVSKFYNKNVESDLGIYRVPISENGFQIIHFEVLKQMLFELDYPQDLIKRVYFDELRTFFQKKGGKYLKISQNYYIFKGYRYVYVYKESELKKIAIKRRLTEKGGYELIMPFKRWSIGLKRDINIEIRPFKYGDQVEKEGKKYLISELFKKNKVDLLLRQFYPLIIYNSRIAIVPGIRIFDEGLKDILEVK